MRPEAVVPILITLVAFILSLLCIFAGDKPGYLEHADLLTVNTSMLGHTTLNTSGSSSSFLSSIESTIKSDINDVVSDIARAINLHDFYSAHVLDYCEGFYTPSPEANLTSSPSKNVTGCSTSRGMFHFDPAQIIQNELRPGLNLTDLKWPGAIQDAIKAIELASKVMFVVYCIGAAAVGLAWIGAMLSFFASGRLSAVVNFMLSCLAFLALLIASSIATGIINKVCNAINEHGNAIGIEAYKGKTFIGMTWAATVLVVLAGFMWVVEFIRGRKQRATAVVESKETQT